MKKQRWTQKRDVREKDRGGKKTIMFFIQIHDLFDMRNQKRCIIIIVCFQKIRKNIQSFSLSCHISTAMNQDKLFIKCMKYSRRYKRKLID